MMCKKEEKIVDLKEKTNFFILVFYISLLICLFIGHRKTYACNLELPPGPLFGFYNPIGYFKIGLLLHWSRGIT